MQEDRKKLCEWCTKYILMTTNVSADEIQDPSECILRHNCPVDREYTWEEFLEEYDKPIRSKDLN